MRSTWADRAYVEAADAQLPAPHMVAGHCSAWRARRANIKLQNCRLGCAGIHNLVHLQSL